MKKSHVPPFGNCKAAGNTPYTQYFERVYDKSTRAPEAHSHDAPATKKGNAPTFGKWEAAEKASKSNELHKTQEADARDAPLTVGAIYHKVLSNPTLKDSKRSKKHKGTEPPKASKPKDALPAKEEHGSVHQAATLVKVPSSEGAIRKTRKRSIHQGCTTNEAIVPPFGDWEKNPELSRKYTKVFRLIGDSRRHPGISIDMSSEETPKQDSTEPEGCGCLRNLFK